MTPYETIRLTASNLSNNESARGICPWCHGGGTREKSFIITRTGPAAKYICHRASCTGPHGGVITLSGSPIPFSDFKKPKPKPTEFTGTTRALSEENYTYLYRQYEINKDVADTYRIRETTDTQMLVIPIYNTDGVQQGHLLKRGYRYTSGKAYTYHGATSDGMAWYNVEPPYKITDVLMLGAHIKKEFFDDGLLIVEDALSAMKANAFINTMSLLGTSFNSEQAQLVALQKYRKVIIALDADASAKAVSLASRLRAVLPMRVMLLQKDIKDMRYADVATLISINYN